MHLGHVLSFAAVICNFAQMRCYDWKRDCCGLAENLLLAAASWFFDVHAAVFIFAVSALTYLFRAIGLYRDMNPILFQLLVIIGGIIFNNRGWLVVFPMLIVWWFVLERHSYNIFYQPDELFYYRGGAFMILTREIALALWIAYSFIIGDWCTLVSRSVYFIRNLCNYLVDEVFSPEAMERRRYLRRAGKYKRHIK